MSPSHRGGHGVGRGTFVTPAMTFRRMRLDLQEGSSSNSRQCHSVVRKLLKGAFDGHLCTNGAALAHNVFVGKGAHSGTVLRVESSPTAEIGKHNM